MLHIDTGHYKEELLLAGLSVVCLVANIKCYEYEYYR